MGFAIHWHESAMGVHVLVHFMSWALMKIFKQWFPNISTRILHGAGLRDPDSSAQMRLRTCILKQQPREFWSKWLFWPQFKKSCPAPEVLNTGSAFELPEGIPFYSGIRFYLQRTASENTRGQTLHGYYFFVYFLKFKKYRKFERRVHGTLLNLLSKFTSY